MSGMKPKFWVAGLVLLSALGGCYFDTLPDPNAITSQRMPEAEVMQRNISSAYASLDRRLKKGEITEAQKKGSIDQLVQVYAEKIILEEVPDRTAFRYADILRQAGRLKEAEGLYRKAVEVAPNDDRRVNDSLQLARVLMMQGKGKEAMTLARSTFDVEPKEKAPIMMAVLYEIVPEGRKKKQSLTELAKLLEESINQHMLVYVDPTTDGGQAFLSAMPRHLDNAWDEVMKLYRDADRDDLMQEAFNRRREQDRKTRSL